MLKFKNQLLESKSVFYPSVAVFVASILVTLLFWKLLPTKFQVNESNDYTSFYEPVARNILKGRGFILTDGALAIRYPPGYPIILAGIFALSSLSGIPENVVHSIFVLLCMGLASTFVYLIAQSIWGRLPALFPALIWMTYPFALWLTKQPNSETPFVVVFYAAFCLFWYAIKGNSRSGLIYFITGFLIGIAMLIRPIALGVGFLLGTIIWQSVQWTTARSQFYLVIMVLFGCFLAILPWEAWAFMKSGRIIAVSTGGVPSIHDGLTFAVNPDKTYRQEAVAPQDVVALMKDIHARRNSMRSLSGVTSVLRDELRSQPLATTKLFALKAARSFYGTDSARFETFIILIQIVYFAAILWSSMFCWKQGGITKQLCVCIWLFVMYFWGMTVLAISILRYMVPAIGLLFVLLPAIFPTVRRHSNDAIVGEHATNIAKSHAL